MVKENVLYRGGVIGYILNGKYYTKREEKHFFRQFNGWAISKIVLEILRDKKGIDEVIIFCGDTKYTAKIEIFLKEGSKYKDVDDEQLVLPLIKFRVER